MASNPAPAILTNPQLPLEIRLYSPEDEATIYTRSIIPWGVLKKAMRLQKTFADPKKIEPEDLDSLSALIVQAFGDRFTIDQLDKGADVDEMVAVMNQIIARAGLRMKDEAKVNPTLPPGQEK
jgi:hypothetical protein